MLAACGAFNRTANGPGTGRAKPVLEFDTLYAENCAGCHGAQGRGGAAIALADPVYLAIVDEITMRKIIAKGVWNLDAGVRAECWRDANG